MTYDIHRIIVEKVPKVMLIKASGLSNKIRLVKTENGYTVKGDEHRGLFSQCCLYDVSYAIEVSVRTRPDWPRTDWLEHPREYVKQFKKRALENKCYHNPHLGVVGTEPFTKVTVLDSRKELNPISETTDYGLMFFGRVIEPRTRLDPVKVKEMLYYHAVMQDGVIDVPDHNHPSVIRRPM